MSRMTAREAAVVLGVGHSGIARTMKRNGIARYETPSDSGARFHVTYDGDGVKALAAMHAGRVCRICGGPVAGSSHITCARPFCIEQRRVDVRNAKNLAARIWARGDGSARVAMTEPRADVEGRGKIVAAFRAHEGCNYPDRLRRTANDCGCNVATVISVLKSTGEA